MSNQVFANTTDKFYANIMENVWVAEAQVVGAGTFTVPTLSTILLTSFAPVGTNNFDVGNFLIVLGTEPVAILTEGIYSFCVDLDLESEAVNTDIEASCYALINRPAIGQNAIISKTRIRAVAQGGGVKSAYSTSISFTHVLTKGDNVRFHTDSYSASFHVLPTSTINVQKLY